VLVRRLLAVAAEKTGQRLQSESARGRKRWLALGDAAAELCFGARGAERGAAEGMGMELSVAPPWELGTAARPAAGFTAFRTLLRGLPWLFELGGAVRSSVRLLGFYCRTDRRTVGGDCCSFFFPKKKFLITYLQRKRFASSFCKKILLVLAMQGLSRYDTRSKGRRYKYVDPLVRCCERQAGRHSKERAFLFRACLRLPPYVRGARRPRRRARESRMWSQVRSPQLACSGAPSPDLLAPSSRCPSSGRRQAVRGAGATGNTVFAGPCPRATGRAIKQGFACAA